MNPVIRVGDLDCEPFQQGNGYASADARLSELIGLTQIGVAYSQVPPGKTGCLFHVHRVEDELFLILEGSGEYRFGETIFQVRAGDILGAPCGEREYAHKLTNTGTTTLKYLSISSKADTDICEYPDSGKFMVKHGRDFQFVGHFSDQKDYWDGEPGG